MPIILDDTQKETTPAVSVPEIDYPAGFITEIFIKAPFPQAGEVFGTGWWAQCRLVPMTADGTKVLASVEMDLRIDNLMLAFSQCPQLAAAMTPLVDGINAYNVLAVAEAKAKAQAEVDRLATEESARVAREAAKAKAEQDRLDGIEAARLEEIERQRLAEEAEERRLEEYNSPEAKAARKAAALEEAARLDAEARNAREVSDTAAKEAAEPAVIAAVEAERLRQVAYDAQYKQSQADQLAEQAAAVRAAAEAME